MRVVTRRPGPLLAPFVEVLWHFESEGTLAHAHERALPTGRMQLLVDLDGDTLRWWEGPALDRERTSRGSAISGVRDHAIRLATAGQRAVAGVAFRAGGAAPFLRAPASSLRGAHVCLADLWGRDGALLRDRMLDRATADARLAVLEDVLVARFDRERIPDARVARALAILRTGRGLPSLRAGLGSDERRFVASFATSVGVTPKRYARLARFGELLGQLARGSRPSWAGLAASCGYFDQAHMIAEFRAFAGMTPTHYRARSRGEPHHAPLDP